MDQPGRFTDRIQSQSRGRDEQDRANHRAHQAFHHPRTSLGGMGHWIRTAGILTPLIIGEFIKDPDRRWRAVRIATVATTLISEGLYTHKVQRERDRARECEYELMS